MYRPSWKHLVSLCLASFSACQYLEVSHLEAYKYLPSCPVHILWHPDCPWWSPIVLNRPVIWNMEKEKHIQPPTYGNLVTILSIDGGGIRGIIPAVVLTFLESELQVNL